MSSNTAAIQVSEFVQALALCWKTLAAYPPGHPALVRSIEAVNRRLAELRGPAGDVTLGISNDGLVYGDLKIGSPAARKLGQALFARGVALVRLSNETEPRDLEAFLRLLAAGTPLNRQNPMWDDLTAAGVININLQPVSYSAVRLTDSLEEKRPDEKERSLWDEILRALIEGRQFSDQADVPKSVHSADELTRLINESIAGPKPEFDPDATFGIRLADSQQNDSHDLIAETVGHYIANAWGMKKQNSLQQAIQLIQSLAPPLQGIILRAVVAALGCDEQAGALMRELATELPADQVLDALRYLSSVEKLSSHSMSLLESLTRVEESKRTVVAPALSVIADLVRVFGDEDIGRFNPDDHSALLSSVAVRIPHVPPEALTAIEPLGNRAETMDHPTIVRQFSATLLDLLSGPLPGRSPRPVLGRIESIFHAFVSAGDFDDARELTEQLQEIAGTTPSEPLRADIAETLGNFVTTETIHGLLETMQSSSSARASAVKRLTEALGANMRRNLLIALAEESNRSRRRRLFDFVNSIGKNIVPDVVEFLGDNRWYVVRNMLILLRNLEDRTSLPMVRKLARHPDLRVKLEAIKSLFVLGAEVQDTLLDDLINDPDPKAADTAITLVGSYGIRQAVGPLLHVLDGKDLLGAKHLRRVKALRSLGELGDPAALDRLRPFFSRSFLPWPPKEQRLAAWESLQGYPRDARQELVERGLRSRDPRVKAICSRLKRS